MPIYVPSKGRAGKTTTDRLLSDAGIDHIVVVEPQDADSYANEKAEFSSILVLPENNRGIAYVRNFILEQARNAGIPRFAMFDDDIVKFGRVENARCRKADAGLVLEAMRVFGSSGLAQMSLAYWQFAWCARNAFSYQTHCDCAVFIDTRRAAGARYDAYVAMKEDWDFSLQLLRRGRRTAVYNRVCVAMPTLGSNKGGLCADYAAKRDEEAARRMCRKWPGLCTLQRRKNGRVDVKVDWGRFRRKLRASP